MADLFTRRADGQPTVSLADVYDANEILAVRYENEHRAREAAERKAKRTGRKR